MSVLLHTAFLLSSVNQQFLSYKIHTACRYVMKANSLVELESYSCDLIKKSLQDNNRKYFDVFFTSLLASVFSL